MTDSIRKNPEVCALIVLVKGTVHVISFKYVLLSSYIA